MHSYAYLARGQKTVSLWPLSVHVPMFLCTGQQCPGGRRMESFFYLFFFALTPHFLAREGRRRTLFSVKEGIQRRSSKSRGTRLARANTRDAAERGKLGPAVEWETREDSLRSTRLGLLFALSTFIQVAFLLSFCSQD